MGNSAETPGTANREPTQREACLEAELRELKSELGQVKSALRDVRSRFEAIYDHHFQMTGLIDVTGRLLMANKTALELIAAKPADVIGKLFWDTPWWSHSEIERQQLREAMSRAAHGQSGHFETTHRTHTGEIRLFDFRIFPVHGDNGEVKWLVPEGIDITERKLTEQALRESKQRYRGVLEDTPILICRFRPDGEITFVNKAYCEYFDKKEQDLLGSCFLEWVPGADRDSVMSNIGALTESAPTLSHDHRVVKTDGTIRWHRWTNRALFDSTGQIIAYQAIGEDVTERKLAEQRIEYQANMDDLTDLPNRRLFRDRLSQAVAHCRRHGCKGAVVFLDIDQFKQINDSLGHPVGDALLKEIAIRLRPVLRGEDTLARLGGDEFILLFPEISGDLKSATQHAEAGAQKIQSALSAPFVVEGEELHVTASAGIALFPVGSEDTDDIIKHADTAMYRAKEDGRNSICFFRPSMRDAAKARLTLQNELRRAISNDTLLLYFQPQVDSGGELVGAEALLRWRHPRRGLLAPVEFLPVLEETGQILPVGQWVLETAMRQLRAWLAGFANAPFKNLSVNLSPRQFRQPDLAVQIERMIEATDADPGCLTLELTEGALIADLDDATTKMESLKRLGVRFSLDDFGTGYSSLSYLRHLPLDEIKIDRSFVRDISTDPNDAGLVETIITMAKHLGLQVVAEGVETEDQVQFLQAHGCTLFQGYYFHRPQPAENVTELLQVHDLLDH